MNDAARRHVARIAFAVCALVGLDPSGVDANGGAAGFLVNEIRLPVAAGVPGKAENVVRHLSVDAQRHAWITTESSQTIFERERSGRVRSFRPDTNAFPLVVLPLPDGDVWYTKAAIGETQASGRTLPVLGCLRRVHSHCEDARLGAPFQGIDGAAVAGDGTIGLIDSRASVVAVFSAPGKIKSFSVPHGYSPTFISAGHDGTFWFGLSTTAARMSDYQPDMLGHLDRRGRITTSPLALGDVAVAALAPWGSTGVAYLARTGDTTYLGFLDVKKARAPKQIRTASFLAVDGPRIWLVGSSSSRSVDDELREFDTETGADRVVRRARPGHVFAAVATTPGGPVFLETPNVLGEISSRR